MKLSNLFLLLIVCSFHLNAAVEINFNVNNIEINGSFQLVENELISKDETTYQRLAAKQCKNTDIEGYELPVLSKLVALPATGNFVVNSKNYSYEEIHLVENVLPFSADEEIPLKDYNRNEWFPKEIISIGKPVIMRGNRFTQISIPALQYNPALRSIRILKDIDLELSIDFSDNRNRLTRQIPTGNFSEIISEKIIGAQPVRTDEMGQYLFIVPQNCVNIIQPLLRWKEKLGYSTNLAVVEEIGSNENDIKDYLQNAYDNWDTPPEFVVMVGDVDGSFAVPAFYVTGYLHPYCVTDHTYTLLEGDDYFPDIFIGRLSFRTDMQLMTIVSKIINYEKNPYTAADWFKSALMVGYVDGSNGFSQREVLMGIRDKLLDFEYTKVDTFISPWQYGTTQLRSEINNGHSFICYRGAGGPNYWSGGFAGQMLTSNDVLNLNNGFMLPMVTSMTCGGGDFAAVEAPSCFGATWLLAGSPSTPQGAIGFIGPSERDTKTWFNNANAMGIYQGITQENITRCGEMLLRGKMELYNNYPFGHEFGGAEESDQFYFYVYNLLGDPGLQIWTDTPKNIEVQVADYVEGMNFVSTTINCNETDLSNFTISITSHDSLLAVGKTDAAGHLNLPVYLTSGEYNITVSKYGYIPESIALPVDSSDVLGVQNYELSDPVISGTTIDLDLDIYNYSLSTAENIEIEIITDAGEITIISEPVTTSSLVANEVFEAQFQIEIASNWINEKDCELLAIITSSLGENTSLILIQIKSPELVFSDYLVQNSSGCLIQNEEASLNIELENIGSVTSGQVEVQLSCLNEVVTIQSASSGFDSIAPDEIGNSQTAFSLIPFNVISGDVATFMLEISSTGNELQTLFFDIPIGIIDENSPTFCNYGYYAIESSDSGNFETPEYNWIEIHPDLGGSGIMLNADHSTINGYIKTVNLPFLIRYFGKYYNQISVCSEGWLAMGETDQIYFRNRNIPSGVGPAAMIAPFWDSLDGGEVYVHYDTEAHIFIIEWYDWGNVYDPTYRNTFEVVLFDPDYYESHLKDADILFQYKEINNIDADDHYATIGIENETQTEGLLLTFAGIDNVTAHPIQSETAIKFESKPNYSIPYLTTDPTEISIVADSDTTITIDINLFNNATIDVDLEYELSFSHFGRGIDRSGFNPNRNIENDVIYQLSGNYVPVMPMDMLFYLVHNSPDGEPVIGVRIDFPDGFHVNSATDLDDLGYNGETGNGAEVSWGFGNGNPLSAGSPFNTKVNLTIEPDVIEPAYIEWYIEGDGSGMEPHFVSGSIEVFSTTENYLWITYPNGGEVVLPGTQDTIRWNEYSDIEIVKIELQRGEDLGFETISASTENDGEFSYSFNGPLSYNCTLKISSLDEEVSDISDSLFSISAFTIVYPAENTVMSYDSLDSLLWQDIGGIELIDIELSLDNGLTWSTIEQGVPNTGKYYFTVPGPPSENCVLKIVANEENFQNQSPKFTIVDTPVSWLSSETTGGIIPMADSETITLNISTSGLDFGSYIAMIRLQTGIGQVLYIPVNLDYYQELPPINQIKLYQNHPNPFNPFTKIDYELVNESKVELSIYNARGQIVKTLVNEIMSAGKHFTWWDGTDKYNRKLSSGIYFYKIKANHKSRAKKMILIK